MKVRRLIRDRSLQNAAVIALAALFSGCSMMTSNQLALGGLPADLKCKSDLGGYYLPKRNLEARVTQTGTLPNALEIGTISRPDNAQYYCLDYLYSWTSSDTVVVERTNENLLKTVSSIASDKSSEIVQAAINIALVGVTGNPNVSMARALRDQQGNTILAQYEFDPFDLRTLADVNVGLRAFGFCIVVDGHTLKETGLQSEQAYCSRRSTVSLSAPRDRNGEEDTTVEKGEQDRGILYRPNLTYQIAVYRRRDPKHETAAWQLFRTIQVQLPNIAPVLSIAVDRSFFVERTTKLTFTEGVLTDARVEKPSEALAIAEIPLRLARAAISVPAEIAKVRIGSKKNEQSLLDMRRELIATERAYADTLAKQAAQQAANQGAGQRGLSDPTRSQPPDFETDLDALCNNASDKEACVRYGRENCTSAPSLEVCLDGRP